MIVNPFHLKKAEMQIYMSGKCKHLHTYQEHPACFQKEILYGGKSPRLGILDIEFASIGRVNADSGIMLSYYIKEYGKEKYLNDYILPEQLRSKEKDKPIVKSLLTQMKKFDVLVTYYGTRCDLPFIRTRALKHRCVFIPYGFMKHIDLYYLVKHKLKLQSNSLENACRLLGINGKKPLPLYTWVEAVTGDIEAMRKIHTRCKYDVKITEKLYDRIINYQRKTNRSI